MKRVFIAVLVISLSACGEYVPEGNDNQNADPCGNGVRDPGESCDGTALGGLTCATEGHAGGTLACTASCSLDPTGCCDHACDAPGDQRCSAGWVQTCALGAGGCRGWTDTEDCAPAACVLADSVASCEATCLDDCPADGQERCAGGGVETCGVAASGCLAWGQTEDCSAAPCAEASGAATCCADACPTSGATRCAGSTPQTCSPAADGCLAWTDTDDCAPGYCGGPGTCYATGAGRGCNDVYNLDGRALPHVVPGWFAGPMLITGTCAPTGASPLWLSYTIRSASPSTVRIRVTDRSYSGTSLRLAAFTAASAAVLCQTRTEVGCLTATGREGELGLDVEALGLGAGDVLWILAYSDGPTHALGDPEVDVVEVDCAAAPAGVTLVTPHDPARADPRAPIVLAFGPDLLRPATGTVALTENGNAVATYDLALAPPEVGVTGNRMRIQPAAPFATGATVAVTVTLETAVCQAALLDTLTFTTASPLPPSGETCGEAIPLAPEGETLVEFYAGATLDALSGTLASCDLSYAGTGDALFTFTMLPGRDSVAVSFDRDLWPATLLTAVVLDACPAPATPRACGIFWGQTDSILVANGLTAGATYTLAVGNHQAANSFPAPALGRFDLRQFAAGPVPLALPAVGVATVTDGAGSTTPLAALPLTVSYVDAEEVHPGYGSYRVLHVPGASALAIAGTYGLESGWDYLVIRDPAGTTWLQVSGATGSFQTHVPGDTAILGVDSDANTLSTGYVITGVTCAN